MATITIARRTTTASTRRNDILARYPVLRQAVVRARHPEREQQVGAEHVRREQERGSEPQQPGHERATYRPPERVERERREHRQADHARDEPEQPLAEPD